MKLTFLKRLVKEDFDKKEQDLISKIAYILNPALETTVRALTKQLSVEDNLNWDVKDIVVVVDSNGVPTTTTVMKSGLSTSCKGIAVIRADNLSNTAAFPTGHPFITYADNSGIISILNITGLLANNQYRLRVMTIP